MLEVGKMNYLQVMKLSGNFTSATVTFMVKISDSYSKIEVGQIDSIIM